jgi:hypothetical protein
MAGWLMAWFMAMSHQPLRGSGTVVSGLEKTVPDPLAYHEYRNMTCVVRMNPPWDTIVPKAEFPWIVFI